MAIDKRSREQRRSVMMALGGMAAAAAMRNPFALAAEIEAPAGWTDVRKFGAAGDGVKDDSAAFQRALREARKVFVPRGRYLVANLVMESGCALLGQGRESILRQAPGAVYLLSVNPRAQGTRDVAQNARGISLHQVQLVGNCVENGFSEHSHLFNANAVSGLLVEDCHFSAFRGDGIYIGSGNVPGHVCHNERVTIRRCSFDGVNGQNRNGVSVIDCDGVIVEDCLFENCSRTDMPGAIDLEPDGNPEHIVRNAVIRRNRILRGTGGVGAICLILPIKDFHTPPSGFLIEDNYIDADNRQPGITLKRYAGADRDTTSARVVVRNNKVLRTTQPFLISGLRDVHVVGNTFEDSLSEGVLSHPNHGNAFGVTFEDNTFNRIGRNAAMALRLNRSEEVALRRNRFRDFGKASEGVAVDASRVNPAHTRWEANEFESEAGRNAFSVSLADDTFARSFAAALDKDKRTNTEPVRWTAPEIRPPQRRRT